LKFISEEDSDRLFFEKLLKEYIELERRFPSFAARKTKLDPPKGPEGLVTSLPLPKPSDPLPASEIERLEKNKLCAEYYHANKEKIQIARKKRKAEVNAAKCEKEGLPDYLGQFISFRSDGSYQLTFKTKDELAKALHWLKFKSKYNEDIYVPKRK